MKKRCAFAGVFAFCALLGDLPGHAADTTWQERDRNRLEGIKERPVAGERFDFVGIHAPSELRPEAKSLYLAVPPSCPLGDTDRVEVREDDAYYWMIPLHKSTLTREPFTWPTADVLEPKQIDLKKLRVTVRNEATGEYCVGLLATSGELPDQPTYVFSFRTPADVILEWQIRSLQTAAVVASGKVRGDRRGCEIAWDGKAPTGSYRLKVTGRGDSDDGEFKIEKSVDFRHQDAWSR